MSKDPKDPEKIIESMSKQEKAAALSKIIEFEKLKLFDTKKRLFLYLFGLIPTTIGFGLIWWQLGWIAAVGLFLWGWGLLCQASGNANREIWDLKKAELSKSIFGS
jgi:hypothetical protein